ncbi:poly-gamma-glutamate synthesis protein (capsule biosynthesis protein) [Nocardioides ginsengisegetis]|uniref:Poly-gamma-glutamate synthesis protein (Capsule biosynthesis protein) n=1 Tax=Nocardioides ginsengisegetis TaxID=661491 RepID=A0A7W3IYF6_9ACTN|nr:poly-gamma-glutamate synthesis protein (capsule biosynthesis protein) [Nocardioides ginsengisegetis]
MPGRSATAALALVVVLSCLAATGCRDGHAGTPRADAAVASTTPPVAPAPRPPRVVTLGFAGDVHFQLNLTSLLDDDTLGPITRALQEPDLTMVNLETAITADGVRDPKELEVPDQRYWYRAPPQALDLLDRSGVDVVTMANNHGADYGPEGLADTLRAARHSPVRVVGIGRDRAAAFTPYRVSVHHTRLAVFAADATPREGASAVWEAGARTPGIAAVRDRASFGRLLRGLRAADPDEVAVVYLHWGIQERSCPSPVQRRMAHALAAAGADVVVGTHTHVQQGAGWLGDTYVAYGLGNFVWYVNHHPDTGVLRVRLEDGHAVLDDWVPAEIQMFGRPLPRHGRERAAAVARWRALRACAGLAARPDDLPAFRGSVHRVDSVVGARCPVGREHLRALRLSYVGFDRRRHRGELVVAARYARDLVAAFGVLYDARWPIRQMRPVGDFGSDDDRSMAADNTSGHNCRRVARSHAWSAHAYGAAVDINPVENPYLLDGSVRPPAGRPFAHLDRSRGSPVPRGTIRDDDVVVEAFAAIGWEWGGAWAEPDYQHFAAPRR